ncbi:MAG: hypothetical protein A3J24_10000 [Deltaproteobacteria bacterium RIFCSPLOWO2_02_FULL_53_8]|nr:MAG: hypothetical protein A3J24_10000 [Deltaproteobacteria bacterium RIFCSPLOWO2_02_FULL_53_8]
MQAARRTKSIIAVILIVIISAVILYYRLYNKDEIVGYLETTGDVEATEVEVASKISGRIVWLCCAVGDVVQSGGEAVRLDSAELEARLAGARASVASANEAVAEARVLHENAVAGLDASKGQALAAASEVRRVQALLIDAKANLERADGLFSGGFITKKDMDFAKAQHDALQAQLATGAAQKRTADANVKIFALGIKAAAAGISTALSRVNEALAAEAASKVALSDTVINAPADGVIVYKSYESGETVPPGASIYTINDLSNMWVRVDIEETVIDKVRLGAPVQVFINNRFDRPYDGRIIEIGELAGFATQRDVTRGRQDIKTFRVKAGLLKPDGAFKPGMSATVRIDTSVT